jgi:hypothetical protein
MASCPPRTFEGISEEHFTRILATVAGAGIVLTGSEGQASYYGFTVEWRFDAIRRQLTIRCADRPFFVGCATIDARLEDLVARCQS